MITGLLVLVIITRSLTPEEFGTWNLIGTLLIYGMILDPIVSYWTTREIARGGNDGRSAIITNELLSIVGIIIFVVIAFIISKNSIIDFNILLIGIILIPNRYLLKVLSAINMGWKPQSVGYATIISEVSRAPLVLLFISYMDLGILGVIIAYLLTTLCNNIIQLILAREKIRSKLDIKNSIKWIKLSWLTLYPRISLLLYRTDIIIFPIVTGSILGVAQFSAALLIAGVVNIVGGLTGPAYARMLETQKNEHIKDNLSRFFLFAIPISFLTITMAKESLYILNPIYQDFDKVVMLLTIQSFLFTLSSILIQYLTGIEKIDIGNLATFRDYIKSTFFNLSTFSLIRFSIYLVILTVMLLTIDSMDKNIILFWAIISVSVEIPFSIFIWILFKKEFNFKFPKIRVLKYSLSSMASFGLIYVIKNSMINYNDGFYSFVFNVVILVCISLGIYTLITYKIDDDVRILIKSVIKEIRK